MGILSFLLFINSLFLINFLFVNKFHMNSTLKFYFVGIKFGYFHHPLWDSSKIKKYAFHNRCCGDHHIYHVCLLISMQMLLY